MKPTRPLILLLALAAHAAVASADTPAPPPAKPTQRVEVSTADAEKFYAFFLKLADAVHANPTDCAKMAAAMNTVLDAHAEVIKMAREASAAGKKLPKEYEQKLQEKGQAMESKMGNCKKDPAVSAALDRIAKRKKIEAPPPPASK
jgi:hypothetical protein